MDKLQETVKKGGDFMNYKKNDKTGLYEAPTDELRQTIKKIKTSHLVRDFDSQWTKQEEHEIVKSIQRKWLVQDGPLHCSSFPKDDLDVVVNREGYGLVFLNTYCHVKEEWRNLPTEYV